MDSMVTNGHQHTSRSGKASGNRTTYEDQD